MLWKWVWFGLIIPQRQSGLVSLSRSRSLFWLQVKVIANLGGMLHDELVIPHFGIDFISACESQGRVFGG